MATLKWSVTGATSLSIDALGPVTGTSTQITPNADASYVLTATNQYGSTQAQTTVAVFPPPAVWFAPIGATSAIPVQGASDYFDLFSTNAAWLNAASHVAVFKMYSQMLDLDDATLRNVFADLKRRHIAFAIEWGGSGAVRASLAPHTSAPSRRGRRECGPTESIASRAQRGRD